MDNLAQTIKEMYRRGGMYLKLLYINVGVFLVLSILNIFFALFRVNALDISHLLIMDSGWFSNWYKPWVFITYMFVHLQFFHLLSNMIILFFVGNMFESYLGSKKVLSTYLLGGIAGALLFFVTQNIFPLLVDRGESALLGASAGVMALFVGLAAYRPNLEVALFGVIRVRLSILAVIYVLLDLVSVTNQDGVAHFAHLGGAFWGYYMGTSLLKGKDVNAWFETLITKTLNLFSRRKSPMNVSYRKKTKTRTKTTPPRDDYAYNAEKVNRQKRLDAILDKIKVGGYESLTKEEKDFLARY